MIKFLQSGNKVAKYLLAGFLLVIAGSMVTYLIPGFMSDTTVSETGVIASVGGHEIRRDEVAKVVQGEQRQQNYPAMFIPYLNQRAVQSLIQQAEVQYESERLGLKVSDNEVQDELQNGPEKQFFYPDNQWVGSAKYREILQQNGLTVDEYEQSVRLRLTARKLFGIVGANSAVADSEVEQAYKDKNTKVKFQYAVIKLEDVLKTLKPSDTELQAYFAANQGRYQNAIPEKRELKYFVVNDKDLAGKVTVDPTEIQRYYSSHQDAYRVQERVKVRHILIETPKPGPDGKVDQKGVDEARTKAQDVLKQVKSGGDFAQLANKYSNDPGNEDPQTKAKKGGELGWIVKGQTMAEFEKAAFGQSKGQISDLVQTSYGFHIIQTEDKEDAHLKPLAEVKPAIEEAKKQEKVSVLVGKTANEAADAAKKQGMEKAAATYGAQVVQSNLVAKTDSLPGIGSQPTFMDSVFSTTDKAGPQAGRIPTGLVIFDVSKIQPARNPAFTEIKDRVANDFKNERASDLLRRKAKEMADRAHAEHDLGKAAKEAGATLKTSDMVARTGQVPDIGSMGGAASAAFTMKPGEISGPLNLGSSQGVLQVLDRQEPSTTDPQFAKESDQLREQLIQEKQQQQLSLFLGELNKRLEKEGKVKMNKSEMDNLLKARS
ncbi:MAG: peptidylprolyl isomerase [Candidatus Angelobacter sp.]